MSLEPISLKLQGRGGWLRPGSLLVSLRAFWGMLRELDVTLSGESRGSVEWEISAMKKSGPAEFVFIGHLRRPPKDYLQEIRRAAIDGVHAVSRSGERPYWFSDPALEHLKVLAEQHASLDDITVAVDGNEQRLEPGAAEHIAKIAGQKYETLSSVAGVLESISVNRGMRFRVCSEITGQRVTCRFHGAQILADAKQYLGQRVIVFGQLTFNSLDEPILMRVSGIEPCEPKESLPNIAYMSGRISKLTGDLKLGDYISRLRR